MIGWTFTDIGKIEKCKGHPPNELNILKNAQYCETCGCFIGRWMSCGCVKVWCKECTDKEKDK